MGFFDRLGAPRRFEPAAGYDRWAATYDDDTNPLHDVEGPMFAALLPPLPGARVLDVGAGTGRHTFALLAAGAAEVVAADVSDAMLTRLRARFGPRVATVRAAADDLPFDAGDFDAVVAALVLAHVADIGRAMAEAGRVLRPGGVLVLTDLHPRRLDRGDQATFVEAGRRRIIRTWRYTEPDLMAALDAAGLRVEERREASHADKGPIALGVRARKGTAVRGRVPSPVEGTR